MRKVWFIVIFTIVFTAISLNTSALTVEMVNGHEFCPITEIADKYKADIVNQDDKITVIKKDNTTVIIYADFAWINLNIINVTTSRLYTDAPTYIKDGKMFVELEPMVKIFTHTLDISKIKDNNDKIYATAEPSKSDDYFASFSGSNFNLAISTELKNKKLYAQADSVANYFGAKITKIGLISYVIEKGSIKINLKSGRYWYTIEDTEAGTIKKIVTVNRTSLKNRTICFEYNDAIKPLGGSISFDKISNVYMISNKID